MLAPMRSPAPASWPTSRATIRPRFVITRRASSTTAIVGSRPSVAYALTTWPSRRRARRPATCPATVRRGDHGTAIGDDRPCRPGMTTRQTSSLRQGTTPSRSPLDESVGFPALRRSLEYGTHSRQPRPGRGAGGRLCRRTRASRALAGNFEGAGRRPRRGQDAPCTSATPLHSRRTGRGRPCSTRDCFAAAQMHDLPGIATATERLAWIVAEDAPDKAALLLGAPRPFANRSRHRCPPVTATSTNDRFDHRGTAGSGRIRAGAAGWPSARCGNRSQGCLQRRPEPL